MPRKLTSVPDPRFTAVKSPTKLSDSLANSAANVVDPNKLLAEADPEVLREAAQEINEAYRGEERHYNTGLACAAMARRFTGPARREIELALHFKPSKLSRYIVVGNSKRLEDTEFRARCPRALSILHLIATLTEDELKEAEGKGVIHPLSPRRDIEAFKKKREPKPGKTRKPKMTVVGSIQVADDSGAGAIGALLNELSKVQSVLPFRICRKLTLEEVREANYKRRFRKELIRLAEDEVQRLEKIALPSRAGLSQSAIKAVWPHSRSDTALKADASDERIKEVLALVGAPENFASFEEAAKRKARGASVH